MSDPHPSEPTVESTAAGPAADQDDGPGWLPAILAGSLLMGIVGFLFCAFSTWVLFQQRTDFAVRTLRGSLIPELEQSRLDPEQKQAVVNRIDELADQLESGRYEQWQAAGVMQRLQRLPVLQWGELAAVETFAVKQGGDLADRAELQFSRLRRAVELGDVTSFDVEDVLKPVLIVDQNASNGRRLREPLDAESVAEVIQRAELLADRSDVPDQSYQVELDPLLRRAIEAGLEGS